MAAEDFDQVIEQFHQVGNEFHKGNAEAALMMWSEREDVSLANPLLGPPVRGRKQIVEIVERAASNYREGEPVKFENVVKVVTPELAFIVEVERSRAKVGGRQDLTTIVLRATTIFRREDGVWKIVHRHADPITTAQPAESVMPK